MADFDHRAAADGIAGCERALDQLWEAMAGFDATRLAAVEDWLGPHRRTYDDAVSGVRGAVDDAHWMVQLVRSTIAVADAEARASEATPMRGPF